MPDDIKKNYSYSSYATTSSLVTPGRRESGRTQENNPIQSPSGSEAGGSGNNNKRTTPNDSRSKTGGSAGPSGSGSGYYGYGSGYYSGYGYGHGSQDRRPSGPPPPPPSHPPPYLPQYPLQQPYYQQPQGPYGNTPGTMLRLRRVTYIRNCGVPRVCGQPSSGCRSCCSNNNSTYVYTYPNCSSTYCSPATTTYIVDQVPAPCLPQPALPLMYAPQAQPQMYPGSGSLQLNTAYPLQGQGQYYQNPYPYPPSNPPPYPPPQYHQPSYGYNEPPPQYLPRPSYEHERERERRNSYSTRYSGYNRDRDRDRDRSKGSRPARPEQRKKTQDLDINMNRRSKRESHPQRESHERPKDKKDETRGKSQILKKYLATLDKGHHHHHQHHGKDGDKKNKEGEGHKGHGHKHKGSKEDDKKTAHRQVTPNRVDIPLRTKSVILKPPNPDEIEDHIDFGNLEKEAKRASMFLPDEPEPDDDHHPDHEPEDEDEKSIFVPEGESHIQIQDLHPDDQFWINRSLNAHALEDTDFNPDQSTSPPEDDSATDHHQGVSDWAEQASMGGGPGGPGADLTKDKKSAPDELDPDAILQGPGIGSPPRGHRPSDGDSIEDYY